MRDIAWLSLLAAAAACGAGGSSDAPDVQAFRTTAEHVDAAAAAYGIAAGTMANHDGCVAMHDGYDAEVRAMVERMRELADAMDAHMASMGDRERGDMACAAAAMMDELDRHHAAACASATDMPANEAEATAHAQEMRDWAEHQRVRAGEMDGMMDGMGGMGGGGMGPGPTTFTCQTP